MDKKVNTIVCSVAELVAMIVAAMFVAKGLSPLKAVGLTVLLAGAIALISVAGSAIAKGIIMKAMKSVQKAATPKKVGKPAEEKAEEPKEKATEEKTEKSAPKKPAPKKVTKKEDKTPAKKSGRKSK